MIAAQSRTGSIPTAILMSGTGSNARKLLEYTPADRRLPNYQIRVILSDNPASNYRRIAEDHGVPAELNDIYAFFQVHNPDQGLEPADRAKLKDPAGRERFDKRTQEILQSYGVQLVALAGYDWVIAPFLCRNFVVLNVHPGDLRVRDARGRRPYIGLGWVPTAKAILAGERKVHSTIHLVTAELDGGPIARVSQGVAIELPAGVAPSNILPRGARLADVLRALRTGDDPQLASGLLVTHAKAVQERLKRLGDWIEFPRTLDRIAALMIAGRLKRQPAGAGGEGLLLDGKPVKDLFLQRLEKEEETS
jgi:folate-dependent phosphoribosylglycinamide formyltransferase PurN